MQTLDYVSGLHNCIEFSQPSSCLDEATDVNTEEVLYCLNVSSISGSQVLYRSYSLEEGAQGPFPEQRLVIKAPQQISVLR